MTHIIGIHSIIVGLLLALLTTSGCSLIADTGDANSSGVDESLEPALTYSIRMNDQVVDVLEGESAQFEGTFTNPQVTVTPHSHRVFAYQGVKFKYPRSYVFEADFESPDVKIWTLTGNDFTIMYFAMNEPCSAKEFANNMIQEFGRGNARIIDANTSITLGEHKLSGATIQFDIAGQRLVTDVYRVPSRGKGSKLFAFQDCLDSAGNRSKEATATLADIQASFVVERAKQ